MSPRLGTALSIALILVGGVALAQADLIVDPWKRVLAGRAPAPPVPAPPQAPKAPRADNGWFDGRDAAQAERPVVEPFRPIIGEESVVDPWVPRPAVTPGAPLPTSAPAPVAEESPHPFHPSNWARVLPDVIDPWGPSRLAAYRDPLIVDPWPGTSN